MKMHEVVAYLYFITISHMITVLSSKPIQQKELINLQEFQRRNIAYLLWYTPTYVVPHKIPLME
jgi:hypothetical protein